IRVVSEMLESNGSSSMGSVCASSMALMSAGVPVSSPVAGVAMGLIKEGDDHVVLTDIAGVEDHLGDMDFKVAGNSDGITALQMDIKISGVTFDILRDALEQAREGRLFILGKMAEAIPEPREQLSVYAPRIEQIKIDPEKIGALIGKGGETIRALSEEFEADINVEDDGTVQVYAPNGALVDACIARIEAMTKEAEVGDRFTGKVVKTVAGAASASDSTAAAGTAVGVAGDDAIERQPSRGGLLHRARGRPPRDHRGGALGALGRARALGADRLARRAARPGGRVPL